MTTISIPTDGESIAGYLSAPEGTAAVPGVVVIHEAFGLTDDIRDYCRRFAGQGFLALAPDLYSRGRRWRCMLATFRALSRREGQAFRDIEAARNYLVEHERCNGKVGVIGFCMGGGFALLMAPSGSFDASSVN
jgi:carboxymethylenebutenolidase